MPNLDVSPPADARVGDPHEYSVTRFFLELISTTRAGWFRTGRWMEEGHVTEAEARNEWDALDQTQYSRHRIIQVDYLCTATVVDGPA